MGSVQEKVSATFGIGILIGLIGVFAVVAGYPWLFASLGPTAALQATMPDASVSRPWNVAVAHVVALGAGLAAVYATGASHTPSFAVSHALTLLRVAAACMAVIIAIALEFVLAASHASGAATALLLALGLIPPDWKGAFAVLCGIALVTALGECLRQFQLHLCRSRQEEQRAVDRTER
jgi:hypothetical protein